MGVHRWFPVPYSSSSSSWRRRLASNPDLIQWATTQLSASRPVNAVFVIAAGKAGVELARGLEQARALQQWARNVADRFQAVRPPPRIQQTLSFPAADLPDGWFWSQKWWDDASNMLDSIKLVTGTAGALDNAIDGKRAEFHILETPWVAMAASANLTFNMKTKFKGARTDPLDRREIALLEIVCGLRHQKPSINRLNYLSARKEIVAQATQLLRMFPVGAHPFTDFRARRGEQKT